jgi:hypothetical protein
MGKTEGYSTTSDLLDGTDSSKVAELLLARRAERLVRAAAAPSAAAAAAAMK